MRLSPANFATRYIQIWTDENIKNLKNVYKNDYMAKQELSINARVKTAAESYKITYGFKKKDLDQKIDTGNNRVASCKEKIAAIRKLFAQSTSLTNKEKLNFLNQIEHQEERISAIENENEVFQGEINGLESIAAFITRTRVAECTKELTKFQSQEWPKIKERLAKYFQKKLADQRLVIYLDALVTRHPWVAVAFDDQAVEQLVIDFMKMLKEKLEPTNTWSTLNLVQLIDEDKLIWPVVKLEDLVKDIEGFPFSNTFSHFNSSNDKFDNFLRSPSNPSYKPKRVDVFRFLLSQDTQNVRYAVKKEGVDCIASAPVHVGDLDHFAHFQWEHFKTLFVNISTEASPFWLMLEKNENAWVMYLPRDYKNDFYKKFPALQSIEIIEVDYANNKLLNDLPLDFEPDAAWHAVLFSRVFPWTKDRNGLLEDYRSQVPMPILVENMCYRITPPASRQRAPLRHFSYRTPFSPHRFTLPENLKPEELLITKHQSFDNNLHASSFLTDFDKKTFHFSSNFTQLDIGATSEDFMQKALYLSYRTPGITTLNFKEAGALTGDTATRMQLLDFNRDLKTIIYVKPETYGKSDIVSFKYAQACMARNRFLASINFQVIGGSDLENRKMFWKRTGEKLTEFFQGPALEIDLEFITKLNEFNKKWLARSCNHLDEALLSPLEWQFAQIAQMAGKGLDVLFNHLESKYLPNWDPIKNLAPRLTAVFDLHAQYLWTPENYLQHLQRSIEHFVNNSKGCHPLFQSLSLVLPEPVNALLLLNFLPVLYEHQNLLFGENSELVLYNLPNSGSVAKAILESLHKQAETKALRLMVRIPAWDRAIATGEQDNLLKKSYRELQNKIQNNRRLFLVPTLKINTESIYKCQKGQLKPEFILKNKQALGVQNWEGDDVLYPLSAGSPGIQQQLQQVLAQQVEEQQQQEQQQEEEQEQEQEIVEYAHDESKLITRHNIHSKYNARWKEIEPTVPQAHTILAKGASLEQLFSLWVGSDQDGRNFINYIEPIAVEKMMAHIRQFRLGVAKENLPAGFYLAHPKPNCYPISYNKGVILCYSEERYKRDLHARANLEFNKRNSFTLELYAPKPSVLFNGDYKQLATFGEPNAVGMANLWIFIAKTSIDPEHLKNAKKTLEELKINSDVEKNFPVLIQLLEAGVDVESTADIAKNKCLGDYSDCLDKLTNWYLGTALKLAEAINDQTLIATSRSVVNSLFNPEGLHRLTPKNLQAFGQLFNHYDAKDEAAQGTKAWVVASLEIWKNFGETAFNIWKQWVLDPSENWAECLDKEEIDALSLSIVMLKDNPQLQAFWWKLVESHGRATGFVRYERLWHSFQKILKQLDVHHLTLSEEAWVAYLEAEANFNGLVFLERLHYVLKKAATDIEAQTTQQDILNNIHRINWRYDGFYYASRFNDFTYWSPALKLHNFSPTVVNSTTSYLTTWQEKEKVLDDETSTHALRYATKELALSFSELKALEELILRLQQKVNLKPSILRLIICCLARGNDSLDKLIEYEFDIANAIERLANCSEESLKWLNKNLSLDKSARTEKIYIQFKDLANFVEVIESKHINLEYLEAIEFIYINGSGRIFDYAASKNKNPKAYLEQALESYGLNNRFFLFCYAPWVMEVDIDVKQMPNLVRLHEGIPSLSLFKKQLLSIDFKKSDFFPTPVELDKAIEAILSKTKTRADIIKDWIQKGCAITLLEAPFRPLNPQELRVAYKFIEANLKINFKTQNTLLFKKLLKDHLAVPEDAKEKTLKDLLAFFIRLDNKTYYNDLGPLLGSLIAKAKEGKKRYSANQLREWLELFIAADHIDNRHYPKDMVSVLLELEKEDSSSLLQNNLALLRESIAELNPQKTIIPLIMRSALPPELKPDLVKFALHATPAHLRLFSFYMNTINHSLNELSIPFINGLIEFLPLYLSISSQASLLDLLSNVQKTKEFDEVLKEIATTAYLKGLHLFIQKKMTLQDFKFYFPTQASINERYSKIILLSLIGTGESNQDVEAVYQYLKALSIPNLAQLMVTYSKSPRPSIKVLLDLFAEGEIKGKSIFNLIHDFETIKQAEDAYGQSKRDYSVGEANQKGLYRVISGVKQKGQDFIPDDKAKRLVNLLFFINAYSLAAELEKKPLSVLRHEMQGARILLDHIDPAIREQAIAKLLAYMREITLRKNGKWANHTQMIALLYAALHNDESLLYQVATGQGKSIITMMRVAYLAFNGNIVDVMSSKVSLSKRDHDEFAPVWEAMGIPHSYITPASPREAYHDTPIDNIGAIHCGTPGNFALFFEGQCWKSDNSNVIDLSHEKRVAFLDECDHILSDSTQLNYTHAGDSDSVYNMEEWVYRVAFDYYDSIKDNLTLKDGVYFFSRNQHLQELAKVLQQHAPFAPKESKFFNKYMSPALKNDPILIQRRDEQLKNLLNAAHTAAGLQQNVNFSIRSEEKVLADGSYIKIRFGKVMIDNQVREGSTYSELVQQFLHVRLNKEAIERGEAPDFFVEPESQIALSLNIPYLLKNVYAKIEGCSGTAGNQTDLKRYENIFGITHVVKLPTHQEKRTVFLPTRYCEDQNQWLQSLAEAILDHPDRPILITCKDDLAVKRIHEKLLALLMKDPNFARPVIKDTNDSKHSEQEILPAAGRIGTVTISARMGRGTDITPEGDKGLLVIRSYAAPPKVAKQERGRQGRNGRPGTCVDIINYVSIAYTVEHLIPTEKAHFFHIYKKQEEHLQDKFKKHTQHGSTKWKWLEEDTTLQQKYLTTRAFVQYQEEKKKSDDSHSRRKEFLTASLSGAVMKVLDKFVDANKKESFQESWLACSSQIELAWKARLSGVSKEDDAVFNAFIEKVKTAWMALATQYPLLDAQLIDKFLQSASGKQESSDFMVDIYNWASKKKHYWGAATDKVIRSNNKRELEEFSGKLADFHLVVKKKTLLFHPDRIQSQLDNLGEEAREDKKNELDVVLSLMEFLVELRNRISKQQGGEVFVEPIPVEEVPIAEPIDPKAHLDPKSHRPLVLWRYYRNPKKRIPDLDPILNFYQQWVQGSQQYYHEKNVSADIQALIYGPDKASLESLFQFLQTTTTRITAKSLREDLIENNKILFSHLTTIFKNNPASFCISCEELIKLIECLTTATKDMLSEYLKAVEAFFNQGAFNQLSPDKLEDKDVEKLDRLLDFTFSLMKAHFVKENNATLEFVRNFSTAIYKYFWNNWDEDFIKKVEDFFIKHPTTLDLLMKYTNAADLGYLLELLIKQDADSSEFYEAESAQFHSYLEKNKEKIEGDSKALLRPLMALFLGPVKNTYIPAVDSVRNEPVGVESKFWYFLTQHQPLEEQSCLDLISYFNGLPHTEEAITTLMEPILALPSTITLGDIVDKLKFQPGRFYLHDSKVGLKELQLLADRNLKFEEFKAHFSALSEATFELINQRWQASNFKPKVLKYFKNIFIELADLEKNYPIPDLQDRCIKKIVKNDANLLQELTALKELNKSENIVIAKHLSTEIIRWFERDVPLEKFRSYLKVKQTYVSERAAMKKNYPFIGKGKIRENEETMVEDIKRFQELNKPKNVAQGLLTSYNYMRLLRLAPEKLSVVLKALQGYNSFSINYSNLHMSTYHLLVQGVEENPRFYNDFFKEMNKTKNREIFSYCNCAVFCEHVLTDENLSMPQVLFSLKVLKEENKLKKSIINNLNTCLFHYGQPFKELQQRCLMDVDKESFLNLKDMLDELLKSENVLLGAQAIAVCVNSVDTVLKVEKKEVIAGEIEIYKEKLSLLRQLNRIRLQFKKSDISEKFRVDFINLVTNSEVITKLPLKEFMKEWTKPENLPYTKMAMPMFESWLEAVTSDKTDKIATIKELREGFKVLKEANNSQNATYPSLFTNISLKDKPKEKRQKIMQYACHGLLSKELTDKCFNDYELMVKTAISLPKKRSVARQGFMQPYFHKLQQVAQEMEAIAKHPFNKDLRNEDPPLGNIENHKQQFNSMKARYSGMWGKNSTRREQANTFFKNLINATEADNKIDYYNAIFNAIWTTQKSILTSDKNAWFKRNKKGYSRLYDLSMQLYINIARDYLSDPSITATLKSSLNTKMEEQFTYYLKHLADRLPKGQLKKHLEIYVKDDIDLTKGSVQRINLEKVLTNDKYIKQVPQHLNYLLENLSCFIATPESLSNKNVIKG